MIQFPSANKSSLMDSTVASTSKVKNETHNNSSTSFTQKLTILAMQDNDVDSELALPLKDTEDDIEPPLKKKCSVEIPTSQVLCSPSNKYKPAIARLKSSCSTPVASNSFIQNLKTPETPYGQIFYDDPVTPETKKKWKKYVHNH